MMQDVTLITDRVELSIDPRTAAGNNLILGGVASIEIATGDRIV
jgi:hypothetical protein